MSMAGMDMSGMNMNMGSNSSSGNSSGNGNMTMMTPSTSDSTSSNTMSMIMSSGDGMCMSMLNGYHFSVNDFGNSCVIYLFPFAPVNTHLKYAAAVIGTFLLCLSFEVLRAGRDRMVKQKTPFGFLQHQSELTMDALKAVSYGLQVWLGYWIMLLVMSYEALIFMAIVSGLSTGYFIVLRICRVLDRQAAAQQQQRDAGNDYKNDSAMTASHNSTNNEVDSEEDSYHATPCCAHP